MNSLLSLIPNLPICTEKPIEVIIRDEVKKRGIDQNGLYWKRVNEIAQQGWFEGRQFSKDVWHAYLGKYEMPEKVETKDGVECSKWVDLPDGTQTVISTALLSKRCFAEYTDIVEAFGAGLGVHFLARDYE